jgi:hypothetical protein
MVHVCDLLRALAPCLIAREKIYIEKLVRKHEFILVDVSQSL